MAEERRRYKALIVDDSAMNREILKEILKDDMDIIEAANGEEARGILKEHYRELDVVLLDLIMPGLGGFEVLDYMRDHEMTEYLPVITISVDDDEANVERAFDKGAIDFISRPFSERIVLRRVLTTVSLFAKMKALAWEVDHRFRT